MGYEREGNEQALTYRHAITENLDYQRERLQYAENAITPGSDASALAELRDAQASFLAVLAVAREAGLR